MNPDPRPCVLSQNGDRVIARTTTCPLVSASPLASAPGRDVRGHRCLPHGRLSLLINHAASVLVPVLQRTVNYEA
ncbi:hypothetical protein [Rothia nasisuis]|uniref:hypothetical protein n=1 Tax=Rothia nasisuis TaxID=2109647 RepID=UPI001F427F5F|nr:hypothetical protein [Rothia nasisuis]